MALRRLAYGTVQIGLRYGIANKLGRPVSSEIEAMLCHARDAGIELLDTASAYGESESVLGRFSGVTDAFRVVTKTIPIRKPAVSEADIALAAAAFQQSLTRLKRAAVDTLLVHDCADVMSPGGERLWDYLRLVREDGRAKRIGVSVYHPEQLDAVLDRFAPDVVQLPFNVYDQRFLRSGLMQALKRQGIEIHARSPFLQGLLLMPAVSLPARFDGIREHHARLHTVIAQRELTPVAACLQFALGRPEIDYVVFGCEALSQMEEITKAAQQTTYDDRLAEFSVTDAQVTDPSTWQA